MVTQLLALQQSACILIALDQSNYSVTLAGRLMLYCSHAAHKTAAGAPRQVVFTEMNVPVVLC